MIHFTYKKSESALDTMKLQHEYNENVITSIHLFINIFFSFSYKRLMIANEGEEMVLERISWISTSKCNLQDWITILFSYSQTSKLKHGAWRVFECSSSSQARRNLYRQLDIQASLSRYGHALPWKLGYWCFKTILWRSDKLSGRLMFIVHCLYYFCYNHMDWFRNPNYKSQNILQNTF